MRSSPKTFEQLLAQMRLELQPKGAADVVLIRTQPFLELRHAEVTACIDEIEALARTAVAAGEKPTPLQRLALEVLLQSSYQA